jgi:ubiquinone/menaquinone biosynthesis C-methylase UbiE
MNALSVDIGMNNHQLDTRILRCPDCGFSLDKELKCTHCSRQINRIGNCFDLLPTKLSENKVNENLIFKADSIELQKFEDKIWRKLIGRLEIERFDQEVLPSLPVGNFLELAGESCWASAMYKSVNPSATVYATDISFNAINRLAVPLSKMFPQAPDVFASVDAETLPFNDSTFDCIFIESAMHHMPEPVKMLLEIKRVLKRNGYFVAIDHAIPIHFRFLFNRVAKDRIKSYGIQEDLVSFSRWETYFNQAGIPNESLQVYTNPNYQRNPLFGIFGKMISILPDSINRRLFPVGLYVVYCKK